MPEHRSDCESQIKGFPNAKYQKFNTAAEAEAFVHGGPVAAPRGQTPAPVVVASKPDVTSPPQAVIQKPEEDEVGWDVVYSDGACRGNGKDGALAGIGVWWGRNDPRNLSERCPGDQTNNRAELIAIARVLETTAPGPKPLLIKTDSQYSINCFHQWLPNWTRNNWRAASGQPVKNKELIQYLAALLEARARAGKVRLKYVAGHAGVEGNEGGDALAVAGAYLPAQPERDWAGLRRGVEEGVKAVQAMKSVPKPLPVEFEVYESDLWSDEEMERIMREEQ
ncbi:ribonuclease H-like protein [Gloeophyllum trabeum ATCC 11539]|uniref:ribonuclease H n=1 Tax=Gloeophyllum trabeum (strain ATCC 11539 / FP-39264 / Madison 617) TaxID=670483 RepID=S7RWK8_GLOTA|nr:ribonuclease H-like protein [Gloeophyllum trabeum ATCC 11539]EPQ57724.1 ribonuclease H-like protein [Gloeophyllum trabeum ATCC 11539]